MSLRNIRDQINLASPRTHGREGVDRTPDTCSQNTCDTTLLHLEKLVKMFGIEPKTYRLKAGCSEPAELHLHMFILGEGLTPSFHD